MGVNNMALIQHKLEEYINEKILPQYANLDKGHNEKHIQYVINKSLQLAKPYNINMEMVYVTASFHDLGLLKGRDGHAERSADIMTKDAYIAKWFDPSQIKLMKEAIEDHSASLKRRPRNVYGKILYQADRNLEINVIVYRAMVYIKGKFPDITVPQQYEHMQTYLQSKYGEAGTLKLWLDDEDDKKALETVRNIIKDKALIKQLCDKYYMTLTNC